MARPARRSPSREHNLYGADTTLGWRRVKSISKGDGDRLVAQGKAVLVLDQQLNRWDYQMVSNPPVSEHVVSAGVDATALTVFHMRVMAGEFGRSRTMGMTEDQRLTRCDMYGKPLPPEDAVERAIAKVATYRGVA